MIRKIALLLLFFSFSLGIQAELREISGVVTDDLQPLEKVSISVEGKGVGTETDVSGSYHISAEPGDVLLFRYMGMEQIEVIVEDVTSVLNIRMYPIVESLDEVVVKERRRKSQKELNLEFGSNKRLIRTKFGILDPDRIGFTMRVVHSSDLKNAFFNIPFLLSVKFPGVYLRTPSSQANSVVTQPIAYLSRTRTLSGDVPILYEVDGVITGGAPFIPIEDIDRIALISGVGGTLRYGAQGAGGVAVINTKHGWSGRRKVNKSGLGIGTYDAANAFNLEERNPSQFGADFAIAKTIEEKVNLYEVYSREEGNDPYFLLEAFHLFSKETTDEGTRKMVMDKLLNQYQDNPEVLKSLAYLLDELGSHDKALEVYQQIFKRRPNYLQSYRDVANAYLHVDESKTALRYYLHEYGLAEDLKRTKTFKKGIDFTMMTEANAILVHKGAEMGLKATAKSFGQLPEGTRILLEWSHGEAEFDLQLVNAENEYFTWRHTLEKNKERIRDEKIRGYSSEQFFLDGNSRGKWKVYLDYFGNKSSNPTFFKVTLFTHYGSQNENLTQKVFRFPEEDTGKSYKLFTVVNGPMDFLGRAK